MNYSSPAVSVVVPVFNGERFLRAALQSLSEQTLENFEVVAIDDGSTDSTPELLRHHAAVDPRLRIVTQRNRGGAAARNRGIAEAQAPLVALLDSDDVALPDRLRRQVDRFSADPDLAVLGSAVGNIDENGTLTGFHALPADHTHIAEDLERGFSLYHPSVMFRRAAVVEVGGYRESLRTACDYDLWLRLLPRRFANISEGLILYRHHDQQLTSQRAARMGLEAGLVRAAHLMRKRNHTDPLQGRVDPVRPEVLDALLLTPAEELSLCAELLAACGAPGRGPDEYTAMRAALRDRALELARQGFDPSDITDHAQVLRAGAHFVAAGEGGLGMAYVAAVVRGAPRQVGSLVVRRVLRRRANRP